MDVRLLISDGIFFIHSQKMAVQSGPNFKPDDWLGCRIHLEEVNLKTPRHQELLAV